MVNNNIKTMYFEWKYGQKKGGCLLQPPLRMLIRRSLINSQDC